MSQLSDQSIIELCCTEQPMIRPFSADKHVVNGKSWGLSAASYDVRVAHDLVLGPDPGSWLLKRIQEAHRIGQDNDLARWISSGASKLPPPRALANTVEDFWMPRNVCGYVCDKSSFARVFVTAFNTLFDPGFHGNATLELVNLGDELVEIKAGDPICQFTFHWLDRESNRPYVGKYQNQPARPMPAIYEERPVCGTIELTR